MAGDENLPGDQHGPYTPERPGLTGGAVMLPSPAELLTRYETWRIDRAKAAILEDKGRCPASLHQGNDDDGCELADQLGELVARLVGRTLADSQDVVQAALLAALPDRSRALVRVAQSYDFDLLDEEGPEVGWTDGLPSGWPWSAGLGRYAMVEQNIHGSTPPYYVTLHDSEREAQRYHVTQEYADDWAILEVYDLDGPEGPRALGPGAGA